MLNRTVLAWIVAGASLLARGVGAQPVQWPTSEGGNGHWYEYVVAGSIAWRNAAVAAAGRVHEGLRGHLATVDSPEENAFILEHVVDPDVQEVWLGGFQPDGSPEPDGGWRWITGERWGYTDWQPGEPNNAGDEDHLGMVPREGGRWNDESALFHIAGFIVEYGTEPYYHGGPLAHWRFDEDEGSTAADSAGLADGELVGAAAFVAGGVSGNALDIPGDGYCTMGDALGFSGEESFTISLWLRTPPDQPRANYVVSRHVAGAVNGYFVGFNYDRGGWGASDRAWFYGCTRPHREEEATSTTSVTDGGWHHVVCVRDGLRSDRIYVDGTPVEGVGTPRSIVASDAHFAVGALWVRDGLSGSLTGTVDDVQVYGRALCDEAVEFLYRNPGLTYVPACRVDLNCDDAVDTRDFIAFFDAWARGRASSDWDGNGEIDTRDFIAYLDAWATGC